MTEKKEYHGFFPIDARISIDYKKKKVDIDYPNKKYLWIKSFFTIYFEVLTKRFFFIFLFFIGVHYVIYPITHSGWGYILGFTFGLPLLFTELYFLSGKVRKSFQRTQTNPGNDWKFEQVFDNIKNKIVRIELFQNWFLEYFAYGDYKKYLNKLEIRELPIPKVKNKKNGQVKRKKQNELWYAEFKFDKVPKEGKLIVRYI